LPSAMSEADGHDYVDRVFTDVGALPFVRDAAISDMPLVMRASRGEDLHGEGSSRDKIDVDWRAVSPDYFHVLGVRMIDGREFTRADRHAAVEPAIVSESVARQLWPEGRAIGRRFQADAHKLTCEVIGVAADMRSFAVRSAPPLMMYLSTDRRRVTNLYLTVRVANAGGMEAIVAPIRQQVRVADPRVAIPDVRTADDLVGDSVADTRMEAALFSVFGALALGVAMAGVAGITAYAVTRRTKELGIRLALGLAPSGIARMLVAESLVPAAIGTAVGSGAALALANLLGHLVFGISARDPATFALVAAGLLAAAIVASYVPARRASRLDPTTALRAE
jgi:putative ABC transport system permease protein